ATVPVGARAPDRRATSGRRRTAHGGTRRWRTATPAARLRRTALQTRAWHIRRPIPVRCPAGALRSTPETDCCGRTGTPATRTRRPPRRRVSRAAVGNRAGREARQRLDQTYAEAAGSSLVVPVRDLAFVEAPN